MQKHQLQWKADWLAAHHSAQPAIAASFCAECSETQPPCAAARRRPKPNAADVELGRLPKSPSHSHARRERREQKARLVGATEGAHVEL